MRVLILPFGKLGATKKAGEELAMSLNGDNLQIKCINKIVKPINYLDYDIVAFGTNIRYGKVNKELKKQLKIFKNSIKTLKNGEKTPKIFTFIVCGALNGEKYEAKVSKLTGGKSVFVGGELNSENATRWERAVINSMINIRGKRNLPLPKLDTDKIKELANEIVNCNNWK